MACPCDRCSHMFHAEQVQHQFALNDTTCSAKKRSKPFHLLIQQTPHRQRKSDDDSVYRPALRQPQHEGSERALPLLTASWRRWPSPSPPSTCALGSPSPSYKSPPPSLKAVFARFAIPVEYQPIIEATFQVMCRLSVRGRRTCRGRISARQAGPLTCLHD
jgi:hypothetical protein